ncbi:MAG TPA: hypothetical protein ACQGQF_06605, partial [Xylella fastidiosa subsp. pauca]
LHPCIKRCWRHTMLARLSTAPRNPKVHCNSSCSRTTYIAQTPVGIPDKISPNAVATAYRQHQHSTVAGMQLN